MTESVILEYSDVTICRDEHIVLSDFNLRVHSGEFVYITGSVGSGKSTLLRSMYAEIPILRGEANILGYKLLNKFSTRNRQALRREMGIVFQDFQLLQDRTAHDNLDIVLRAWGHKSAKERDVRIKEALDKVGLTNKGYKYPSELSGGEQQHLSIARALLGEPRLIIADEPTANLDRENGLALARRLHEVSQECHISVIMATHNPLVLEQYPARIVSLEK